MKYEQSCAYISSYHFDRLSIGNGEARMSLSVCTNESYFMFYTAFKILFMICRDQNLKFSIELGLYFVKKIL